MKSARSAINLWRQHIQATGPDSEQGRKVCNMDISAEDAVQLAWFTFFFGLLYVLTWALSTSVWVQILGTLPVQEIYLYAPDQCTRLKMILFRTL